MTEDNVNHPSHYGGDVKYEAIKIIDDWCLGFSGGNALKYIIRAPHKGNQLEDLKKAHWYLNHALEIQEGCVESRPQVLTYQLDVGAVVVFWELNGLLAQAVENIRHLEWFEARLMVAEAIRRLQEKS